jgi:hypothetical protein
VIRSSTVWIAGLILGCSFLTAILAVGYSGNDIAKECNANGRFAHIENDHKVTYLCSRRIEASSPLEAAVVRSSTVSKSPGPP